MTSIRLANTADAFSVIEIMNQAIAVRANAYLLPFDHEEGQKWFEELWNSAERLVVYEVNEKVVAWANLSAYRKGRGALKGTSEITFYVHHKYHKRGIASALIHYLEAEAKAMEKTHLLAILIDTNLASKALLEKHQFDFWGQLPNIANFGTETAGQFYYGKDLRLINGQS